MSEILLEVIYDDMLMEDFLFMLCLYVKIPYLTQFLCKVHDERNSLSLWSFSSATETVCLTNLQPRPQSIEADPRRPLALKDAVHTVWKIKTIIISHSVGQC